jgi:hypothetical protein
MLVPLAACGGSEENTDDGQNSSGYHTITFNTKGGSHIGKMSVKHGTFAAAPADPTMDNYVFCRWEYTNKKGEKRAFFFDVYKVEEDMELEAIWIKAEDLFALAPMPDSDGIMITKIKRQEDFDVLYVPGIINGKTVEGIGDNAFRGIIETHADAIVFPDSIRYVGASAFSAISEVEIFLTGTITHIDQASFASSLTLRSIKLGKGITVIPYNSFNTCISIKTLDIPEGVETIEENAFEKCTSLLTVVLPSTLTRIENAAFNDCDSLKSVFFGGTQEQFDNIDIDLGSEILDEADLYLYSEEQPTEEGKFWHYDKNGLPEIW